MLLQIVSPSMMLTVGLLVITFGVLFVLLSLGLRQHVLLRMGLRNMLRRPSRTLLLVSGLLLATMVITTSFGLSDSLTHSILAFRQVMVGQVDESVSGSFNQAQVSSTLARLRASNQVRAATAIWYDATDPTIFLARTGLAVHRVDVYALPPDFDQVYGPLTDHDGQSVYMANLPPDDVLLSPALAQGLGANVGDTVQLAFLGSPPFTGTVRALLSSPLAVTSGEAIQSGSSPEIVLPLARMQQQVGSLVPNILCVKNSSQGDAGNISPGQHVVHLLQQIFPGAPISTQTPGGLNLTQFDAPLIHPLQPDVVNAVTGEVSKVALASPATLQFLWFPPLFTYLLVGAGMLLLVLLVILLAAERRAELGMSRAIGLTRSHLVLLLLLEGGGYSVVASILGVGLGIGVTALQLAILVHLPHFAPGEAAIANVALPVISAPLQTWLSWQSLLSAWCLGVLTTLVVLLLTALWISRMNIVAAIRDLDAPFTAHFSLPVLFQSLWASPRMASGETIPETKAHRLARQINALTGLLWGLISRGPLCLVLAAVLFVGAQRTTWLAELAVMLLIAGGGLLLIWASAHLPLPRSLVHRLGVSLIGLGWLIAGFAQTGIMLSLFQSQSVLSKGTITLPSSVPQLLASLLVPLLGAVVLVMGNVDLLAAMISGLVRRIPGMAPISRTSLAYPLTFRLRLGVSVILLSLVSFLILLLVIANLGSIQEAETTAHTGGFQLQASISGPLLARYPAVSRSLASLQNHSELQQDFSQVAVVSDLYPPVGNVKAIPLSLAGSPTYPLLSPLVANDTFLSTTTMPLLARAAGYNSDQQVWDALRDHPGYAVLCNDPTVAGLPHNSGFAPFTATLPTSFRAATSAQRVTIIGVVPQVAYWQTLYLSSQTATAFQQLPPFRQTRSYLFRLRPGVSETQGERDLNQVLETVQTGISVQSLDQSSANGMTAILTLFLAGYMALGLLFGAFAIGVIASRAVVERRQQIGMLRALGYSRWLILSSFLLEAGFVILLSLVLGGVLAGLLACQIASALYVDFPFPGGPVSLILLGSFLIAAVSTLLPARQAIRLHPAEALRYE